MGALDPMDTPPMLLLLTLATAMLPQLTMATTPLEPTDLPSVMLRLSQRLMLTTVVSMVTLDMALDPMDTPPMLLLHTPAMAMLPQPTTETTPLEPTDLPSVMLRLSQRLMLTMLESMDTQDMPTVDTGATHTLMDHMLTQPIADTITNFDVYVSSSAKSIEDSSRFKR